MNAPAVEIRLAHGLSLRRQLTEVQTLLEAVGDPALSAIPELGGISVCLHAAFAEVACHLTPAQFAAYARLAERKSL